MVDKEIKKDCMKFNFMLVLGFVVGVVFGVIFFYGYITSYTNSCVSDYNKCATMYNDLIIEMNPSVMNDNYLFDYINESVIQSGKDKTD